MKVRQSVFETNSSSTHSLVLASDMSGIMPVPFAQYVIDRGVVDVQPDEYGWEIESYTDPISKLSYLYVDAMRGSDDNENPNDPETRANNEKLSLIVEAVKYHTGLDVNFIVSDDKYYPFGYIDHQSVGLCDQVYEDGINSVIRFVFSNASYFETDNDNH